MEVKGRRWIKHFKKNDEFRVWNIADIHLGSKSCAIDQIHRDITEIKNDPYSFWVGGGDYAEYIGIQDFRFDPDAVADTVKVSDLGKLGKILTENVRDLLSPIKHKCLGLVFGNHEKSYQKWQDQSALHQWLCLELGVHNLGYSAFFDVVFSYGPGKGEPRLVLDPPGDEKYTSNSFRFFVHHGAGFATTPAGKLTRLIRFMDYFDADIYMLGHVHDQQGKRIVRIGANETCTKLVQKEKLGLISGSYYKTYQNESAGKYDSGHVSYGEQKGYGPTVLGSAIVYIKPMKRELKGEI